MSDLKLRPADGCRYDLVALGEVLLRFDPGDLRISTAVSFTVWEGGGEYNVARGLSGCFGLKTGIATALVDNSIGRLIKRRIAAGGVDTGLIKWLSDDGIGESRRNGIYFLERGFGLRPAMGVFDRGHSAIAQIKPGEFDWQHLFGELGVRWFHTGGIMAGLAPDSPQVVIEAMKVARQHGAIVSYDLNYRPSLWRRFGGKEKANAVNRAILAHVDVLFGIESLAHTPSGLESGVFRESLAETARRHPHLKVVASTMRVVKTPAVNDWSGILWHAGDFYEGPRFENLAIYDRVGAGDGFAAGVIHGLLSGGAPQSAIDFGVAHGALAMTTPGDTTMATLEEVEALLAGERVGVIR